MSASYNKTNRRLDVTIDPDTIDLVKKPKIIDNDEFSGVTIFCRDTFGIPEDLRGKTYKIKYPKLFKLIILGN